MSVRMVVAKNVHHGSAPGDGPVGVGLRTFIVGT